MEYKGYDGKVEFDDEASVFHGDVVNIRDVITFQGKRVAELRKAFRDSVEDYLAFCAKRGEEPDKPFSGQFIK
jgi:predicted HicB family RNase H-like nuclease